jgi:glycosyltransferase involved in cell wall biosynthesis
MVNRTPADFPLVSIIVPCRNEEAYIGACLDSILASDYPGDRLEVLVAEGCSEDRTSSILSQYAARYPSITVLENASSSTPAGLNLAIRRASGDIVIRMDAHVFYPAHYIPRLVAALEESGADNVGGVLETVAAENTPLARAIAIGLSHPFGVGNSYFRTGTGERREVDTVPFGCYRREIFDRLGLFDEELIRNQDDEFNFRLLRRGGRILLLPDVSCRYFARRSLRQLARMYYQYGYFKPLVARKVGRVMTLRQLAPATLVASLLLAAALSPWFAAGAIAFSAVAATYALFVLACSLLAARGEGLRCGAALAAVFPTIHLSYGIGFLHGIHNHLLARAASPAREMGLSR